MNHYNYTQIYNTTSNAFWRKPKYTQGQVECMRRQGYEGDRYGPPMRFEWTEKPLSTSYTTMTPVNTVYWG